MLPSIIDVLHSNHVVSARPHLSLQVVAQRYKDRDEELVEEQVGGDVVYVDRVGPIDDGLFLRGGMRV